MRKEGKDLDLLPIIKEEDLKTMLDPHNRNLRVAAFCNTCGKKFVTKPFTLEAKGFFCKSCKLKESRKKDTEEKKLAILEKYKKTCKEKYGTDFAFQSEDVKEKFKQTCLEKYGVSHPSKDETVKKKTQQTCLEKYGVNYALQSKEVQSKIKETMLERYGVEHALQSEDSLEKLKQTNLEKYGVTCTFNWDVQKEKTRKTLMDKYGVSNGAQCEGARKKQHAIWQERSPEQKKEIRSKSSFRYSYKGIKFDSAWELYLWIYAEDHGEAIEKDPITFNYEYLGNVYTYIPDFKYKDKLIEIKGDQFFKEDGSMINPFDRSQDSKYEAKHQCGLKNGVEFWSEKELQFAKEYVEQKYTKDFVTLFKYNLPFPYPPLKKGDFWVIKHFHKSLYEASRKGTPSPVSAWQDKNLILKSALNRLQYVGTCSPEDVLTGFNVAKIAPKVSIFKPEKAKDLIERYLADAKEIFDPFSGFSGRMVAVCRLNKKYIGQDIHPSHVSESNEIAKYLNFENYSVTQQDILTDTPKSFETLFTCPPYGGKEHWNENNDEIEKSCDEWIDICLEKYDCKKYLFVVDKTEKYSHYIVEQIENKSHFGSNKELVLLIQK